MLSQFIVCGKGSTKVRVASRVGNQRRVLAQRDRFAARRVVARLDLQDSDTGPVTDVSELGLPPMSLVDRSGSRDVLIEAPLARGPLENRVGSTAELAIRARQETSGSTAFAAGRLGNVSAQIRRGRRVGE